MAIAIEKPAIRTCCTAKNLESAFNALQQFRANIVHETIESSSLALASPLEVEVDQKALLQIDKVLNWMKTKAQTARKGISASDSDAFSEELAIRLPTSLSDIPEDVMHTILLANAQGSFWTFKTRSLSTRSFSQVCKTWRSMAFNCPAAWCHIIDYVDDSTAWIEELLKRSRGCPLDIQRDDNFGTVDLSKRPDVVEILFRNIHRWRHVNLRMDSFSYKGISQLWMANPMIESLELCDYSISNSQRLEGTLFSDDAPKLRSLALYKVPLDFGCLPRTMGALTDLKIHQDRSSTLDEWLTALRNAPSLKYIQFDGVLSLQPRNHVSSTPVTLPHLSVLHISSETPNACKSILDSLSIPSHCALVIDPKDVGSVEDAHVIGDIVKQKVDSFTFGVPERFLLAQLNFHTRSILISNLDVNDLRTSSEVADDIRRGTLSSVDAPIYVRLRSRRQSPPEQLSLLLRFIGFFENTFSTTTSLRLYLHEYDTSDLQIFDPLRLLVGMEYLRRLEITGISYKVLFPILRGIVPDDTGIALPSLELIRFQHSWTGPLEAADVAAIEEFLRWRKEKGHPIPVIDAYNAIPRYLVAQSNLRKIVQIKKSDGRDLIFQQVYNSLQQGLQHVLR